MAKINEEKIKSTLTDDEKHIIIEANEVDGLVEETIKTLKPATYSGKTNSNEPLEITDETPEKKKPSKAGGYSKAYAAKIFINADSLDRVPEIIEEVKRNPHKYDLGGKLRLNTKNSIINEMLKIGSKALLKNGIVGDSLLFEQTTALMDSVQLMLSENSKVTSEHLIANTIAIHKNTRYLQLLLAIIQNPRIKPNELTVDNLETFENPSIEREANNIKNALIKQTTGMLNLILQGAHLQDDSEIEEEEDLEYHNQPSKQ